MKRCILVDVREGVDKKTNADVLYITLAKLPSKMSDGKLWHQKSTDLLINTSVNKTHKPELYNTFKKAPLACLVDIDWAFNEFSGQPYVRIDSIVAGTEVFKPEQLYI